MLYTCILKLSLRYVIYTLVIKVVQVLSYGVNMDRKSKIFLCSNISWSCDPGKFFRVAIILSLVANARVDAPGECLVRS